MENSSFEVNNKFQIYINTFKVTTPVLYEYISVFMRVHTDVFETQ